MGGIIILVGSLLFFIVETWPALGAQGADYLRHLIGDQAVARLEMEFNRVQDNLEKLKYRISQETPIAPWNTLQASSQSMTTTKTLPEIVTSSPEIQLQPTPQPTVTMAFKSDFQRSATASPSVWRPAALIPLGTVEGEGLWSEYIQDMEGTILAYRTFLQPDPDRPYTLVAVVAMDLTRTRLHFVLGTTEPAGKNNRPRSGAIPASDRTAGVLLAAFNGGFQARHGQYGAMADGIVALPPRVGFGTLVIARSGSVSLGEWTPGSVITPNMAAFRQNGPLVVKDGQINPRIHSNSPLDWGYTVNDVSPTVRTGIGLSADGKTLFYFCGPSLSMEALAIAMQASGAWNAIQLDINNYWSLFVKFLTEGSKLTPEALLPRLMVANVERFLWNYSRDYFYLTSTRK